MKMKKKILYLAAVVSVALTSCMNDEFVGNQEALNGGSGGAITFGSATPTMTRATGGDAAATLLANNFVVFGYKTVSSSPQTVFDNYQVNYVANTANTTESNSANWEYVSYKNLPVGVSTNVGVGAFSALTGSGQANETAIDQTIKYWDFSATQYDFFAYSLGAGSASTWAKTSAMSNSTYTLEGTAAQLGTCYISNKKNVAPSTSATEVQLEFRSFLSKIELMFYEVIPGYSVKSLSFYPSAAGVAGTTPYLYTSSEALPTGGKYTVTFDTNGKAQLAFDTSAGSKTYGSNIAFSSTLEDYASRDYKEADIANTYIGRASNDATSTDEITVLPNPQNDQALHLKMDFTLVSRDGSGETINMTGATAVIPAAYAMWQPNYKYTYMFKISDNTNAKTAAITGLYPITLDAVVTDAVDGTQETITTVDDPSITTYAKGEKVTANNEYLTGANIYIVVNDGTDIEAGTNAKLYTATITLETPTPPAAARPAAQGITEETVKNALENGGSVVDANGATLAVTAAAGLSDITEIDENDAPNGHAISIDGVKFTPAATGDYVFEYTKAAVSATYYDAEGAAEHNAGLSGAISTSTSLTSEQATTLNGIAGVSKTTYAANENPTADDAILYNATLTGHVSAGDEKTPYVPASKHYKVIKVVAP